MGTFGDVTEETFGRQEQYSNLSNLQSSLLVGGASATLHPATEINADWRRHMSRRRFQNPTPFQEWGHWYIWVREDFVQPNGKIKRRPKRVNLGSVDELTKHQAERRANEFTQKLNSTNYRPRSCMTFAQFAEKWMNEFLKVPHYSPSNIPPYRSGVKRHLIPALGELSLADIGPEHVDNLITTLAAGKQDHNGQVVQEALGKKTIRNLVILLQSMYNKARNWNLLHGDTNWFEGVKKPRAPRGKGRVFTQEQAMAIIETAEDPYSTFYWLIASTGMRPGEALGLLKQNINFDSGLISLDHSVWGLTQKELKVMGSERDFSIGPSLLSALARLILPDAKPTDYVFHTCNGTPWGEGNVVKRHLKPILKALGIPLQRAGLYAFRHTVGTEWGRRGVPLKTVQEQLGHEDASTTSRYYMHAVSEDRSRASLEWSEEIAPLRHKANGQNSVVAIHPLDLGLLLEAQMATGTIRVIHHLGTQECTVSGKRYRITRDVAPSVEAVGCVLNEQTDSGQPPQSIATLAVVGLEEIREECSVAN